MVQIIEIFLLMSEWIAANAKAISYQEIVV